RMFALKFKGLGLLGNEIRYGFIIFSAIMIKAFTKYAIPAIIITYIVVSAIRWAINRNKK
ncbi:MAG: phosphatidylserine synthase, partial [Alistipes sp.]|nr:phosphatidylserine synthase [Alistipes sp.]